MGMVVLPFLADEPKRNPCLSGEPQVAGHHRRGRRRSSDVAGGSSRRSPDITGEGDGGRRTSPEVAAADHRTSPEREAEVAGRWTLSEVAAAGRRTSDVAGGSRPEVAAAGRRTSPEREGSGHTCPMSCASVFYLVQGWGAPNAGQGCPVLSCPTLSSAPNAPLGTSKTGYPAKIYGTGTGTGGSSNERTGTGCTGSSYSGTGPGTDGSGSETGLTGSGGYPAVSGSTKMRTGTGTSPDRFRILGTGTGTTHIGFGSGTGGAITVPVPKAGTRSNQLAEAAATNHVNLWPTLNKKSCFEKEKQALLHFKASIYGDPFGLFSTWKPEEDDDCCNWSGITCNNQTGHVTKLKPKRYSLEGEISPSLVNLTYLNHLDLSSNHFDGTIPNFIGSMTQLRHLDLSWNNFLGTIPNSMGSLTQLRYLDLSFNSFYGVIPKSIGSLSRLRCLNLSFNPLDGSIPPELGNLTSLRVLSLETDEKRSSTIENLDWLSNLSHLQHLQMDGMSLAKANQWVDVISSLPKLSYLSLWQCNLSEVMHPRSSFVNSSSSSIQYLNLKGNNLNSSMYHWLFPLTSNKLLELDLSENILDGIPKYLGDLCSLRSLKLSNNPIAVKFDDFLNNLSGCTMITLETLDASYNQLTGSLSDEIQKFPSLVTLLLLHNRLNGTMSEKVWELPNLQTLYVFSNSLIISPNIGKSRLQTIDISDNSLVVTPSKAHKPNLYNVNSINMSYCNLGPLFPKWIQTHKNLSYLDISSNQISDTIPVQLWKTWPSRLTYLNLSSNNVSGIVLDLSSNFDRGAIVDLSSNNFYGPILNFSPTLRWLNLSKNKFNGGISFLCQISDDGFLTFLDLSHNAFTGQLPDCLWHFKYLSVLNLGHNNLSGRLPASIGYLIQLQVLDLSNNSFSGELPLGLKKCTMLNFLNLGANNLFGNVPNWVGENLTKLYVLSLKSNNFSGTIPLQLCHLISLQILDLSMNNLGGSIPSCVSNLKAMVNRKFWSGYNTHLVSSYMRDSFSFILSVAYADKAMIEWQGNEREFTNNLGILTIIDLSNNNLTGQIPNELVDLHELIALNLSKNALFGEIPRKIGEMKNLLTLDLSRNKFSGAIPSSMSQMAFLDNVDMSHNSLSGRIPSSTQLQSFPPSSYAGNPRLCGPPLTKNCPGDEVPSIVGESESGEESAFELERWFYIGGSIGFATGFWMACGALLLNHRGRHAFFHFVDFVKDWVYVKVVVLIRKLERVANA
ncbi:hypothetical protein OSB04_010471 [Centaurea solstitialis]|uniref:Leucine-rich repeat-containing N-terminal plant-type domain-containing protein n=1 Tax=Centaurea solstitialis TaxID=347529 RepID=A0AA38WCV2_9ASTR|nr:hypothetical protein OSB04_010471 [Centaurea solstitialis]